MRSLFDAPIPTQRTPKPRPRTLVSRPRRFNRVLVPIDFSGPSLKAIPYALAISRQFGADVHLLHVTDVAQQPPPTLLTLPLVPQAEWNQRFMKRLRALARKYRTDGNVSALEPRTGTAYEEICAAARELKADLIVIATHGYTGYERVFLGSTAERVVQHSPCPVLVVREHISRWNQAADPRTRTGFRRRRILAPTDFSECSLAGFDYAVQLARDFKAELQLVYVINPHLYPFGDQYAALDPVQLMGKAEHAAENQMRSMAAGAKVRSSLRVIEGSPAIQILNAANEDVDLVVISTHGRTGLGHILIGSVAEHVVRYAHCPVLVIPARPQWHSTQPAHSKMKTLRTIGFVWLCMLSTSFAAARTPATRSANSAPTPLTFTNAVSFFKAAKFRATEVQPRCAIFFEGEWKSTKLYDYCVIMVENSDEDIQVTFYLTDAHEMNWVTEFLDSQFFNRRETEKLFQLMNARSDVRGQNVGRFRVDFHHWQPRHAQLLVFSFTPLRGVR